MKLSTRVYSNFYQPFRHRLSSVASGSKFTCCFRVSQSVPASASLPAAACCVTSKPLSLHTISPIVQHITCYIPLIPLTESIKGRPCVTERWGRICKVSIAPHVKGAQDTTTVLVRVVVIRFLFSKIIVSPHTRLQLSRRHRLDSHPARTSSTLCYITPSR